MRHGDRALASNALWNFLSTAAPLLAALFAVPFLIGRLGVESYGLLTLLWTVAGYFALLDMGVGRALTQFVARTESSRHETNSAVQSSLLLLLFIGAAGALVLQVTSSPIARLIAPANRVGEVTTSFRLLAVSLPFITVSSGARGILEAQQRFGVIAAIRTPFTLLTYLGPAAVVVFSQNLVPIAAVLAVTRIVGAVAIIYTADVTIVSLHDAIVVSGGVLRFAGWTSLSSLVAPALIYCDRFFVSAIVSTTAVALYATPYEVISRLLLIPGALAGVLFPAFASNHAADNRQAIPLLNRGLTATILLLFPITLAAILFAEVGFKRWLGAGFAGDSVTVARWLAVGVFINGVAYVPSALLQGVGRPDISAKLGLIELPLHVTTLIVLIRMYGIPGAAIASTLRVGVDCFLHFFFVARQIPGGARAMLRPVGAVVLATAILIAVVNRGV
jgi:O-antigen/teichoic acid export membrane protein